jgi:hypothetical protein
VDHGAVTRVFSLLATAVRVVASVIGAMILIHAAFVLFEANPGNPLVEFTNWFVQTFAWFTVDLFTGPNPKMAQVINEALAAILYVVVGSLLSKMIIRLAPEPKKSKAS